MYKKGTDESWGRGKGNRQRGMGSEGTPSEQ